MYPSQPGYILHCTTSFMQSFSSTRRWSRDLLWCYITWAHSPTCSAEDRSSFVQCRKKNSLVKQFRASPLAIGTPEMSERDACISGWHCTHIQAPGSDEDTTSIEGCSTLLQPAAVLDSAARFAFTYGNLLGLCVCETAPPSGFVFPSMRKDINIPEIFFGWIRRPAGPVCSNPHLISASQTHRGKENADCFSSNLCCSNRFSCGSVGLPPSPPDPQYLMCGLQIGQIMTHNCVVIGFLWFDDFILTLHVLFFPNVALCVP